MILHYYLQVTVAIPSGAGSSLTFKILRAQRKRATMRHTRERVQLWSVPSDSWSADGSALMPQVAGFCTPPPPKSVQHSQGMGSSQIIGP